MNLRLRCLTFVLLLLPSATVFAADAGATVTLSPGEQTVKQGEVPRFIVRVQAHAVPLRVLKFSLRADLRHAYARITLVTRAGNPVDVPRVISDPGPTSDADYTSLNPGQSVSFAHDGMPLDLSKLKPGDYLVSMKLWPDWRSTPVTSNSVALRVVGP